MREISGASFISAGEVEAPSSKRQQGSASESFSAVLDKMKKGGAPAGGGSSDDSSDETTTVMQVMSDGSALVTTYEGDKIVSQTKTRAAHAEENPMLVSTQVEASETAASLLGALGK